MTQISVRLALKSRVTDGTDAPETVDQVDAFAAIAARIAQTFVHIHFAVLSAEAFGTGAVVLVDEVDARAAVETLAAAVVQIRLAIDTRKAFDAATRVTAGRVLARFGIAAHVTCTFVHILIAGDTLPAVRALAPVAVFQVDASGCVQTR